MNSHIGAFGRKTGFTAFGLLALAASVAVVSVKPGHVDAKALDDGSIAAIYDRMLRFDIEAGRLAAERGESEAVRALGAAVAEDHGPRRRRAQELAASRGIPTRRLTDDAGIELVEALDALESLDRARFDRAYLSYETAFARAMVARFTAVAPRIEDDALRQFVTGQLPHMSAHVARVKATAETVVGVPAAEAMVDTLLFARFDQLNSFDIEAARLGAVKGVSREVRELAARILHDHAAVRQMARDLAEQRGVVYVVSTTNSRARRHTAAIAALEAESGVAFDRAYLEHEIAFHRSAIKGLREGILPRIATPAFKALVESVLPGFEQHLAATADAARSLGLKY